MSEKSKSTIKSIGIVFWVLLLAKIVAFANDAILAAYLGTSMEADAFYMVLGIQQVLYPMLSVGIWKVFLPEYKKRLTLSGRQEADSLANKMLLLFGGISVVFAGLIFIFHKGIVMICAPGLSVEGKALCGELLQISAPLYIFIIISTIIAVMLQCHGKFLGSQIREVVSHIPTIVFAIFLYGKFGVRVLAYSLVVGSILRLLVELPFIDWGFRFQIRAGGFNHEEKKTLKRIPEALLTAGVEQINTLVDKIMASGMAVGSISALNYAHKIMNVFSGLFASAIGTTLYPKMAQLAAENDHQSLENMLRKSICIISFFMVPITIGSLFYSELIIACVFQRGNFGIQATRITAAVYGFYAIGLLFIGLKDLDSRKPKVDRFRNKRHAKYGGIPIHCYNEESLKDFLSGKRNFTVGKWYEGFENREYEDYYMLFADMEDNIKMYVKLIKKQEDRYDSIKDKFQDETLKDEDKVIITYFEIMEIFD